MAIKTSSEVTPYLKMMLFGDSGSGKTTLAASAQKHPDLGDVLFLSIDKSFDAVAHDPELSQDDEVNTPEQVEQVLWKIAKKDPEYARFKTLVIDNATALQNFDLEEISRVAYEKKDKNHPTQDTRFVQDYIQSNPRCFRILRTALSLPMNVIITAWEKVEKDEETGRTSTTALLSPGLRKQLFGFTGQTWALIKHNGKRGLVTKAWKTYDCKTRQKAFADLLPEVYEIPENEPVLPKLFSLYKQSLGKK